MSIAKQKPSAFVAALIASAARPHRVIDFPLVNDLGEPVARVHIRGLAQAEEDLCFANARAYMLRLVDDKDDRWKPDELEHNARASEILAVACRKVDDPSKPFFENGVVDTREFETEVLGQLINAYATVKEDYYPLLREMTPEAMDGVIALIAEGAEAFPFFSLSRATLEALSRSLVMSLVDARATITTLTDSSTSDA